MNVNLPEIAAPKVRQKSLVFFCIAMWVIAAASTSAFGIWLAIGGTAIALGIFVWIHDSAGAKQSLRPSLRLVLLGLAFGAFQIAITYLLYPVIARMVPFIATDTTRLYSVFRTLPLIASSIALLPIILGEELVWRGVVQAAFARRLGAVGGVALSAVAYAIAHAPLGSPVLVITALLCGLYWGGLRVATRSLVPTFLAHILWDVLVLLWLPVVAR